MGKKLLPPSGDAYHRALLNTAMSYAPTIYACAKCGWPVVSGYCCGTCGDADPRKPAEPCVHHYRFDGRYPASNDEGRVIVRMACVKCQVSFLFARKD